VSEHVLTLFEDRLAVDAGAALPATPRVLYVLEGEIAVATAAGPATVAAHEAWHGTTACSVRAGRRGATVLRYELTRAGARPAPAGAPPAVGKIREDLLTLDPGQAYLMRCDRVDFAPGGEAMPHGHRGGGIRRLLEGALEVRIGGHAGRLVQAGDAWFESGVEAVHAIASREAPTSFVRVSILPRELRGKSSIVYVDPAHASVKPRRYTVHVDEPIELP
jgi:quercetin dioxygenase-like cupin family protein